MLGETFVNALNCLRLCWTVPLLNGVGSGTAELRGSGEALGAATAQPDPIQQQHKPLGMICMHPSLPNSTYCARRTDKSGNDSEVVRRKRLQIFVPLISRLLEVA